MITPQGMPHHPNNRLKPRSVHWLLCPHGAQEICGVLLHDVRKTADHTRCETWTSTGPEPPHFGHSPWWVFHSCSRTVASGICLASARNAPRCWHFWLQKRPFASRFPPNRMVELQASHAAMADPRGKISRRMHRTGQAAAFQMPFGHDRKITQRGLKRSLSSSRNRQRKKQ